LPTTITAIIPAYNEEKTIANVLKPLSSMSIIDEIIVISDGSHDNTAKIARAFNARVIELEKNHGKTNAVITGVKNTDSNIILMLDADLIGLRHEHIMNLLLPVINKEADMTIGIFKHGRGATDFAQKIAPFLSGQRVITRSVFDKLNKYNARDYGIEVALTHMAEKEKIRVKEIILPDLTHMMKEEKRGVVLGFLSRLKMYWDILFCAIKCKFN